MWVIHYTCTNRFFSVLFFIRRTKCVFPRRPRTTSASPDGIRA